MPRWTEALKKEIAWYKGRFKRFDSLYFGGGTPSMLETALMSNVMDYILSHFDFDPDSEITIEANPCDLTPEKISALRGMGFNRVSLGVQSFDDRTLTFLGRNHTAIQAENALTDLRAFGFENLSMDLIYGIDGQSKKEWIETLKRAMVFQPEHLSCYQLTIEKKTSFGRLLDKGLLQPLNEKAEEDYFLTTSRFLEEMGYIHYEISSFARGQAVFSQHNGKYWQHTPYLGLGPSAHSFCESSRWWNVRSVRKYCEALEDGRAPVEGSEYLSEEQLRHESIMLGLRTRNGVDKRRICHKHQFERMLSGLQDSGFLRIVDGRVFSTRKGFLVADYLAHCLSV
jgi:oxygen-independent coproporphyrinogen-3 oxidase